MNIRQQMWFTVVIAAVGSASAALYADAIMLTTPGVPYAQDFDTLASESTSSVLPAGWLLSESGTNADTTYAASTGSSNAGNSYSFGAAGNAERALGGLLSSNLIPTVGAYFKNDTGQTIISLDIAYTGEQWRLGATDRQDRLDFQYSLDATSLTTGTWTDVDALDFGAPNVAGTVGLRDGNVAANRTVIPHLLTNLTIPHGATFYLRWNDFNAMGADDGLAVDDFSLTAQVVPLPMAVWGGLVLVGAVGCWNRVRRRGDHLGVFAH